MELYVDSADVKAIREIASWGVLRGATTNPTLLSQQEGDPRDILYEICEIVDGPVSAEVVSRDVDGMVREARELAAIHKHIVVKLPMTEEGLKATHILSKEGIRVNMTLVFTPSQALLAAAAGATFVSPFLGRLDDISSFGVTLIENLVEIFDQHGLETRILAASIRHPMHVVEVALAGADIASIPPKVFKQMVKHPLTDIGLERFIEDWKKAGKRL